MTGKAVGMAPILRWPISPLLHRLHVGAHRIHVTDDTARPFQNALPLGGKPEKAGSAIHKWDAKSFFQVIDIRG